MKYRKKYNIDYNIKCPEGKVFVERQSKGKDGKHHHVQIVKL
tara:strand:- start:25 stop:150 length:126 start_codon:yes stop_codon:yes gene_type:complete